MQLSVAIMQHPDPKERHEDVAPGTWTAACRLSCGADLAAVRCVLVVTTTQCRIAGTYSDMDCPVALEFLPGWKQIQRSIEKKHREPDEE